jgi:hypothetical protein
MSEDDAPVGLTRPSYSGQLPHEIGIGQAMKPVPLETELFIASRDRQEASHTGHVTVKRRVEAGDLRDMGVPASKCLDQLDLHRQMFRIIGTQPS